MIKFNNLECSRVKILFVAGGFVFLLEASSIQDLLLCYRKREITCNATFVKGKGGSSTEKKQLELCLLLFGVLPIIIFLFLFQAFLWTFHLFLKTAKQLQDLPLLLHFLNTNIFHVIFLLCNKRLNSSFFVGHP